MARPSMQECSICRNEYGGKVVPTLLICCEKDVCFICVENDRNRQIAALEGNRKQISCMYADRNTIAAKIYHGELITFSLNILVLMWI